MHFSIFQLSRLKNILLLMLTILSYGYGSMLCKCNDHERCLLSTSTNLTDESYCKITKKGHCYFAKVVEIINENSHLPVSAKINRRFGCLSTLTKSILSCNGHTTNLTWPVAIKCCNKTNFCNAKLNPNFYHHVSDEEAIRFAINVHKGKYKATTQTVKPVHQSKYIHIVVIIGIVCAVLCCIPIFLFLFYRKKIQNHIKNNKIRMHQQQNNFPMRYSEERDFKPNDPALVSLNNGSIINSAMIGSSLMTNSTFVPAYSGLSQNKTLVQRTISHQILIRDLVGKGRFGEMWLGEWRGDQVMVRLFMGGIGEKLWIRTINLYYSCVLRHCSVLGLLGSDRMAINKSLGSIVQPMLLYPHFDLGTLSNLMASSYWDAEGDVSSETTGPNQQQKGLSKLETLEKMALSIVAGLCYLHTEIAATKGKPAIAHRNLKSNNIYVKDDYSCCVGDLEWALVAENCGATGFTGSISGGHRYLMTSGYQCQPQQHQQQLLQSTSNSYLSASPPGLITTSEFENNVVSLLMSTGSRYLAPELLNFLSTKPEVMLSSHKTFDDYKKADVYSLSMILWEMIVWFEPSIRIVPECDDSIQKEWQYLPVLQSELISFRHKELESTERPDDKKEIIETFTFDDPPSVYELTELVVKRNVRPRINFDAIQIPNENGNILHRLCYVIPQCWCTNPDARLNCYNIKKYIKPASFDPIHDEPNTQQHKEIPHHEEIVPPTTSDDIIEKKNNSISISSSSNINGNESIS